MRQDKHYKKLLFVDQSLEELITQHNSETSLFSVPYQYWHEGKLEAAIASLKQITNTPTSEIRHKLWAWKALQQMGEALPASITDEVQGVVFEIPVESWIDTLAVYSDGRLRYMNGMKGVDGLIIWENTEHSYIRPMIIQVISAATSLVGIAPAVTRHNETNPTTQNYRHHLWRVVCCRSRSKNPSLDRSCSGCQNSTFYDPDANRSTK
jgi:hypothetical protein